ncbi:TNF receptor-associated factor 1 isoform X1 [Ambystoma mexicanum]|uniref:TNF receptor-associated factor 1 isoform X1 n=1 Tax=Ambystoma mexicanum TaxID=8296 RepID=UPI0037E7482B
MAEKTSRVTQRWPSSFPDENECPLGYPTNICDDAPGQKYLCCNCNNVLKKAQQSLCGHRYCSACLAWILRNTKSTICQKCKEEDPRDVDEGSLLTEERVFSDAAINKEISELKVHCDTPGCSWNGVMKAYEDHQSLCEHAFIPCPTGCGLVVMRRKLADHLDKECPNNMMQCPKCKRKLSNHEYQKHMCESSCFKERKHVKTDGPTKEKNQTSSMSKSREGCRFSEIGCYFRGSKEKTKEHEKFSMVAHLSLMLQFIKQCKTSLLPVGMAENGLHDRLHSGGTKARSLEKSFKGLQVLDAEEVTCNLDVDFSQSPSNSQEEMTPQMLAEHKRLAELEEKLRVFENIAAVLSREVEASSMAIAAFVRQSAVDQDMKRSLEQKITDLQRSLALKDVVLNGLHMRLLSFEQTSYDGVFLWKIPEISRKCHDAITGRVTSLYSPAFYTARYGYKVCLRVYLNGDGPGKGTHVSLFFAVMKGEYDALLSWPFKHKVTFMLLDQNNREHVIDAFRPDLNSGSFLRPVGEMNVASGCPMFLPSSKLQSPKHAYVKDDTIFLKCIIDTNS